MHKRRKIKIAIAVIGVICSFFGSKFAHASGESKLDSAIYTDELESFAAGILEPSLPGFSYLVSRRGKIISKGSFGLANVEKGIKNSEDTVYRVGSITKQFTAASVLILANEGKLSVEDKLSKYFPKLPNSSKITIRNLLTHTSGMWDQERDEDFPFPIDQYVEPQEHLSYISKNGVFFEPGKEWRYSSNGYFVLGLIVEKVSGKSLGSFMEERIFIPLKMKNTGLYANRSENQSIAVGYGLENGVPYKEIDTNMKTYNGAAALCSTINDLFIWSEALHNGKVLPKESYNQFIEPYEFDNGFVPPVKYGFGIGIEDVGGHLTIGHPGQLKGFQSDILRLPPEEVNVIFLSNINGYHFPVKWRVTDKLINTLYGRIMETRN
jgi:CubicO group peptidase (beta-lactamase class C family)